MLSQQEYVGQDRPVAYFSRKLLPREEKYAIAEKDCMAINLAIQHFCVYLLGKHCCADGPPLHCLVRSS